MAIDDGCRQRLRAVDKIFSLPFSGDEETSSDKAVPTGGATYETSSWYSLFRQPLITHGL